MPQVRVLLGAPILQKVGARGFEPPTSCAQGRRATRLRYAPLKSGREVHGFRGPIKPFTGGRRGPAGPDGAGGAAGTPAMRQTILLLGAQFGQRAAGRLRGQEERVVS